MYIRHDHTILLVNNTVDTLQQDYLSSVITLIKEGLCMVGILKSGGILKIKRLCLYEDYSM